MDTSTIVNFGKKYLTAKVVAKAGKALLTKRTGLIGLGIGAAAGAGYLAYSLVSKNKGKKNLTKIDDIEGNNHELKGDKKIVI